MDINELRGYVFTYNQIVRSVKKELPNDPYIEQLRELTGENFYVTLPVVRSAIPQLRLNLEQRYLK